MRKTHTYSNPSWMTIQGTRNDYLSITNYSWYIISHKPVCFPSLSVEHVWTSICLATHTLAYLILRRHWNCFPSNFSVEHVMFMQNTIHSKNTALCKCAIWKSQQQLEDFAVTISMSYGKIVKSISILKLTLFNTLTLWGATIANA